jgi:hypothetical protein
MPRLGQASVLVLANMTGADVFTNSRGKNRSVLAHSPLVPQQATTGLARMRGWNALLISWSSLSGADGAVRQ